MKGTLAAFLLLAAVAARAAEPPPPDLQSLDRLIAERNVDGVYGWASKFRYVNRSRPAPEVEARIVAVYDDPRMAHALLWALERYESPALAARLADDIAQLAAWRRTAARECRMKMVEVKVDPRFPQATSARSFGINAPMRTARLQCPASVGNPPPENARREMALQLVGATGLPGMAERLAPLIRPLATPVPADAEVLEASALSPSYSLVGGLKSIAGLVGDKGYQPAAPEIVAVLQSMRGIAPGDFTSAFPLLKALSRLDTREGSQEIARWIELRSRAKFAMDMEPPLRDFVVLLAPVLPEAQVDVAAVRDRVMPSVTGPQKDYIASLFRYMAAANQGLEKPGVSDLINWARQGNEKLVRYVVARGVPIDGRNDMGETALTEAIPSQWEMQKLLVELGASPDLPGRFGVTPLHKSVGSFYPSAIEPFRAMDFYLAHGADVNNDSPGRAPLHAAAERYAESTLYLLQHKANVNSRDKDGGTPLHAAVAQGKIESARVLLTHGANVDATRNDGATPLHVAARSSRTDLADLLIRSGANVNAEMTDRVGSGLTPLQIARDQKSEAMEKLLEKNGASASVVYLAKRNLLQTGAQLIAPFIGH